MASVNAPRGLVIARKNGSGSNSTGINTINITQTSVAPSALMPTSMYTGDPLIVRIEGTIVPCEPTATDKVWGVFQGVSYVSSTGAQKYSRYWTGGATATDVNVHISDDPQQTYFVQADASCTSDRYGGYKSANADIVAGSGGSTKTGNSSYGLDADTGAVAQFPLRVIRRATWDTGTGTSVGASDAYPWWEVRLNTHIDNFVTTTASTG
jgi:hypothetical protein